MTSNTLKSVVIGTALGLAFAIGSFAVVTHGDLAVRESLSPLLVTQQH